ncbi:diguanylate cyclase domain-containing protein [Aeromonas cavernicola]|uniref:GGDEF domain-containing protein n=1 Tax=Aeromonas cavernicola TaxID=1006623 RepID=UPI0026CF573B
MDNFYRNVHWNMSQLMLESQRFLDSLRLYRAGELKISSLSLAYDLLWNRLDIFLVSRETEEIRKRDGLDQVLLHLFALIRQIEPQMTSGMLAKNSELARLQQHISASTDQIQAIGERLLSGQEQESSVSKIRHILFWVQLWQLVLLLTGVLLVLALLRANMHNRRLSLLDPLTVLGNRRALEQQLTELLAAYRPFTLVVLDLKRFKQVNDLLGYQVGDRLLQTVADKLQQFQPGFSYRLGGDEFAVIVCTEQPELDVRLQALGHLLHFEFTTREGRFLLACRMGVASAELGQRPDILHEQAILALNRAKQDPVDDVVWFKPALYQQQLLTQHQLRQLRDWLAGMAVSPLVIQTVPVYREEGEALWQLALSWRDAMIPCEMKWLHEGGILGQVIAHLLQQREPLIPSGSMLLIPLDTPAQLVHVLSHLPAHGAAMPILLLPSLPHEAGLLAQIKRAGCTLALRELGSATVELLAEGWPIRYWLPNTSSHTLLLQPLAQRLGLGRLLPAPDNQQDQQRPA